MCISMAISVKLCQVLILLKTLLTSSWYPDAAASRLPPKLKCGEYCQYLINVYGRTVCTVI